MSAAPREWHLDTRRLGRRVVLLEETDSTNNRASELADDRANDGIVILANHQSAGRGQHRRTWLSWPGTGVLMSILLFPPPLLRRPAVLTAWAAVSVCEAVLEVTGRQARIKWPNDVLLHGRKVCGILIEQGRGTVVGIGLNVNQPAATFTEAELAQAGSLASLTGQEFNRDDVARSLVRRLDAEYDLACGGDLAGLEACWKWRLGLLGRPVAVECRDGVYHGRLRDVTFERVQLDTVELAPEAVLHLEPV